MFQDQSKQKKRDFLLYLLLNFFSISIISTGFLLMFLSQSNTSKQTEIRASEASTIQAEAYFISYKMNRLTSDLKFVTDILQEHLSHNPDYSEIAAVWLAYSRSRAVYDQIRYIDLNGNEVIRINYDSTGSYVVPSDELQNKKDRYYFQNTISLDKNQIYISPLDLNIENNQIEQPLHPMIRLATPFFDPSGNKAGIVILNYAANDIIKQMQAIASSNSGYVFLLNSDGFWLYNEENPQKEWAFMYGADSKTSFAAEYPEEWSTLQSSVAGTIVSENGFFQYSKMQSSDMFPTEIAGSNVMNQTGDWYIVSMIPASSPDMRYFSNRIDHLLLYVFKRYYVFYFVFLGISIIISLLYVDNKSKKAQVKYYSEYDIMTSSYNRNTGIQRLNSIYKNLAKSNCTASICFLDVNGLKEVNDVLGHETGDALLILVANTIRSNIRANDFMIRFGGDEFIIVFVGIGRDVAEQTWERIVSAFNTINATGDRPYLVSVSHGIQEINCDNDRELDEILQQADAAMYEEKRRIKSNIQILRR